jgi:hypothetical protein
MYINVITYTLFMQMFSVMFRVTRFGMICIHLRNGSQRHVRLGFRSNLIDFNKTIIPVCHSMYNVISATVHTLDVLSPDCKTKLI